MSNNDSDGAIDLSSLSDTSDSAKLKSKYTTDGAHLTKAGQQALVNAIDTSLFN